LSSLVMFSRTSTFAGVPHHPLNGIIKISSILKILTTRRPKVIFTSQQIRRFCEILWGGACSVRAFRPNHFPLESKSRPAERDQKNKLLYGMQQ